jgi:hypothetical protein
VPRLSLVGPVGPASLAGALGVFSALLSALGCAHVSAPPGGPPDSIPPGLIAIQPPAYSVLPGFKDEVRFEFDETISEQDIETSVTIYPAEGRPRVKKGKRELKVRPRAGWRDGRIYQIRVDPVIKDLFGNAIREPIDYVFSTGPPIGANRVAGVVFDRITGGPLPGGRVDMVLLPDTLRYGGVADTAGAFAMAALPAGDYLAIGYEDVNGNRRADAFDRSDTLRVALGSEDTVVVEFQVFHHDTVGPRMTEVVPVDSVTVELRFDGYLDPDAPVTTANVEIYEVATGTPVALDTVFHAWAYRAWRDSVEAARRAAADTLSEQREGEGAAAADTSRAAPRGAEAQEPEGLEEPQRLPDRRIYVIARTPIPAAPHEVSVRGVRNLSGLEGGGEGTFEPEAAEPAEGGEPGGAPE